DLERVLLLLRVRDSRLGAHGEALKEGRDRFRGADVPQPLEGARAQRGVAVLLLRALGEVSNALRLPLLPRDEQIQDAQFNAPFLPASACVEALRSPRGAAAARRSSSPACARPPRS